MTEQQQRKLLNQTKPLTACDQNLLLFPKGLRSLSAFRKAQAERNSSSLALGIGSTGLTTSGGGLGVLTAHLQVPVVTDTSVRPHLLKSLKILTELGVKLVGGDVVGLAVLDVPLSVEEPRGDLELHRVLKNGDHLVDLLSGELTSTLVLVDVCLLADHVRHTPTDTLDDGQGVHDLLASVNIGVEDTQNVLEVLVN